MVNKWCALFEITQQHKIQVSIDFTHFRPRYFVKETVVPSCILFVLAAAPCPVKLKNAPGTLNVSPTTSAGLGRPGSTPRATMPLPCLRAVPLVFFLPMSAQLVRGAQVNTTHGCKTPRQQRPQVSTAHWSLCWNCGTGCRYCDAALPVRIITRNHSPIGRASGFSRQGSYVRDLDCTVLMRLFLYGCNDS